MERHISARRSCNYVMTRSRRGHEKSKSGGFENRFRKLPVPFDFRVHGSSTGSIGDSRGASRYPLEYFQVGVHKHASR
jgi:hypothetical protein